jgi:predicted homoserine dehydrogenase-like protein
MTLHHLPQQHAGVGRLLRVGLIGARKFGPMFLSRVQLAR